MLDANYYKSEIKQAERIISIYSAEKEDSIDTDAPTIAKQRLANIISDFNDLYDDFLLVVRDYYNVRSAEYLSFNSNVQTNANVNL